MNNLKYLVILIAMALPLCSCSKKGPQKLIPLNSSVTIEVGDEHQLAFKVYDRDFKAYDLASNPWHLKFTSSDESVATVSAAGLVKALKAGKTMISVSSPDVQAIPDFTIVVAEKRVSIPLTLASYNIRYNSADDTGARDWKSSRKTVLCNLIRQRSFDVCGFVEVTQASQSNDLRDQLGDIYNFVLCGRNDGATSGEAVGFGFKKDVFTLIESGHFFLNTHPATAGEATEWYDPTPSKKFGRSRIATWGLLEEKVSKARLLFIVSHFELNKGMRAGSAMLVVEKAKELAPEGVPVFFCGDLNAAPTETTCSGPLTEYFKDSYDEAVRLNLPREGGETTYNAFDADVGKEITSKRIDYMYYHGDNVELEKYGVIYNVVNGILPSDHYPIYINIQLKR